MFSKSVPSWLVLFALVLLAVASAAKPVRKNQGSVEKGRAREARSPQDDPQEEKVFDIEEGPDGKGIIVSVEEERGEEEYGRNEAISDNGNDEEEQWWGWAHFNFEAEFAISTWIEKSVILCWINYIFS